jgi:hypothetical protein
MRLPVLTFEVTDTGEVVAQGLKEGVLLLHENDVAPAIRLSIKGKLWPYRLIQSDRICDDPTYKVFKCQLQKYAPLPC